MKFSSSSATLHFSLLGLASFLLAYFALSIPIVTWDTVAYIATIFAGQHIDPVDIHTATYTYLQERLSAAQFADLTTQAYAAAMAENASYFYSQLGMYMVKPLYVLCARLLTTLGLDPLNALMMLSLLPGIALSWLLFFWLRKSGSDSGALLLTLLFVVAARLIDTSRVPIPDNLSAMLIFASVYLLLTKAALIPAMLCLLMAVGVRTNNIIFVAILLSALTWKGWREYRDWKHRQVLLPILALLACILAYAVISARYDQEWWRLFYHTFIEPQVDLGAFNVPFEPGLYAQVLISTVRQMVASGQLLYSTLPLFLLIFVIGIRSQWHTTLRSLITGKSQFGLAEVCFLSFLVIGAFFVLFPLVFSWDRFFIPFYGFFLIQACERTG